MSHKSNFIGAFSFTEESDLPPAMPNRKKFRTLLSSTRELGRVISSEQLRDATASTTLKIRFAKESFYQISKIDVRFTAKMLNSEDIPELKIKLNLGEYYRLIRELDSFVFELYGSFDYFSNEINLGLGLGLESGHCSFSQVKNIMETAKSDNGLRQLTIETWHSDWFEYLRKLRNRLTHRNSIIICFSTSEFFFPDDPLSEPDFIDRQMKLVPTCCFWLEQSLDYIEEATAYLGEKMFSEW